MKSVFYLLILSVFSLQISCKAINKEFTKDDSKKSQRTHTPGTGMGDPNSIGKFKHSPRK